MYVCQVATLPGTRHEVVRLAASPTGKHLAVGYHNGDVKVFDIKSGEDLVTFSGHKSSVSCLIFDSQGMQLASGSRVSSIIASVSQLSSIAALRVSQRMFVIVPRFVICSILALMHWCISLDMWQVPECNEINFTP